ALPILEKIDTYCSTDFQPVGRAGVSPAKSPAADKMSAGPTAKMAVPRVTVELVRELVPLSRAGVIFELGNALAARDLELSLKLVRRLLDQRVRPWDRRTTGRPVRNDPTNLGHAGVSRSKCSIGYDAARS